MKIKVEYTDNGAKMEITAGDEAQEYTVYKDDGIYMAVLEPAMYNDPVEYFESLNETLDEMKLEARDYYERY